MEKLQKRIVVKLQVEGTHSWSDCDIDEVNFLRQTHRHLFYIRVEKEVKHNNRDIEIIKLKHDIVDFFYFNYYQKNVRTHCFKDLSCEDIAEILLKNFDLNLVEVLEDNENGAIVRL